MIRVKKLQVYYNGLLGFVIVKRGVFPGVGSILMA